jgi:ribosomal protein S18 acetylase RimI-like enzyme
MKNPKLSSKSNFLIRPRRESDLIFFRELYRSARADIFFPYIKEFDEQQLLDFQLSVLESGIHTHFPSAMEFIGEYLHDRIGGITVDFSEQEVRIIFLAVTPTAQNYGFGTKMIEAVKMAAQTTKAPVTALVWRNNPAARSLYTRQGFIAVDGNAILEKLSFFRNEIKTAV